jgi:hypothetical protein
MGIDLREPIHQGIRVHYDYFQWDFCNLPSEFIREHIESFDAVFSISAIEHFGMGTYKEGEGPILYDAIASRQVWQLLKEGGHFYVTVPFGKHYMERHPYWRVYNSKAARERLIQDFYVESSILFFSAPAFFNGKSCLPGDIVTLEEASQYSGFPPHLTLFMKMRKPFIYRMAPRGK